MRSRIELPPERLASLSPRSARTMPRRLLGAPSHKGPTAIHVSMYLSIHSLPLRACTQRKK